MNRKQRRAGLGQPLTDEHPFALAVDLHRSGRLADAAKAYARIAAPSAQALSYWGAALFDLGKPKEALARYRKAIQIAPDYADAHYNMGLAHKSLEETEEAILCYRRALALDPNLFKAYSNLAVILRDQGNPSEAADLCRRAIAIRPDHAEAHANLGNALLDLARPAEAAEAYRNALHLRPDFSQSQWGEAFALLLAGDFAQGWAKHEARWAKAGIDPHGLSAPLWRGDSMNGKTILAHCEQGLGDTLQFIRFCLAIKRKSGADLVLLCPPPLRRLLTGAAGIDRIVTDIKDLPPHHARLPLMSAPFALGITRAGDIPDTVPYLSACSQRTAEWAARLPDGAIRIGIAWQGNPKAAADKGRSIPLSFFAGLAELPGVRLISLQKSFGTEQIAALPDPGAVQTLGTDFDAGPDAFMDAAAVMMSLDLIITSDTAIAHLAGALGRPVWVVVQYSPDWRWMLDRDDSPWYPSMRLFRQRTAGDWSHPFDEIKARILSGAGTVSRTGGAGCGREEWPAPPASGT
jgi:Flp pilus assembly protein TadD